jgi:DNA-binding transcriptional LysR family regulator
VPYLGYAPGAYLGQVLDSTLNRVGVPVHLDRVYETDMSEGLKAMALEGHGLAFLPQSAVRKELRDGALVSALPAALKGLQFTLEMRLYREKPTARSSAKKTAQALWDFLQTQDQHMT